MGWGFNLGLMPYGQRWRMNRSALQQWFSKSASLEHRPSQREANVMFLQSLLLEPKEFYINIRRLTAAAILRVTHGLEIRENNDPFIQLADDGVRSFAAAAIPGSFFVDWIPALRFIPEWFPGAGFKRQAREWREVTEAVQKEPFERWSKEKAKGAAHRLVVEDILEKWENIPNHISQVKGLAAVSYLAGSDTTASTITSFIMAMVLNPEAQRRAQNEIDTVVGLNRLPEFEDQASLPYVEAIVRETLRLFPSLPLGIAHAASEADEFEGMYIPKRTWVIPNVWAILRDPDLFRDPQVFNPARHLTADGSLDPDGRNPHDLAFGFGRRVCPGRYFAQSTVWLASATVLACFNISPATDNDGRPILPPGDLEFGLLTMPKPFPCEITVRSDRVKSLLRDAM